MSEVAERIDGIGGKDETIYISNNLPYIATLEYGGYPNPVQKGTWNKKTKSYEQRSANGFSKQAPNGMVGITMANVQKVIREAVDESGFTKGMK